MDFNNVKYILHMHLFKISHLIIFQPNPYFQREHNPLSRSSMIMPSSINDLNNFEYKTSINDL